MNGVNEYYIGVFLDGTHTIRWSRVTLRSRKRGVSSEELGTTDFTPSRGALVAIGIPADLAKAIHADPQCSTGIWTQSCPPWERFDPFSK
jgi:hypothetical protein